MNNDSYDAIVIGAGLFGCRTALTLASLGRSVCLIDREHGGFRRASLNNQSRVHNGYHYPRDWSTALGSHRNYSRFLQEFGSACVNDFTHLYAIPRQGSKVTARQFRDFCEHLDIPLEVAPKHLSALFSGPIQTDEVFVVDEAVVDTHKLSTLIVDEVAHHPNVDTVFGAECTRLFVCDAQVHAECQVGSAFTDFTADMAVNATYAGASRLLRNSEQQPLALRAEVTEVCMVRVEEGLSDLGITVMDGPFFSMLPSPSTGFHSLSHVRYTPHLTWDLRDRSEAYTVLAQFDKSSRFQYMRNAAAQIVPSLRSIEHVESLFELKAIPDKSESTDGRPILYRVHSRNPLLISVLGSKLDSIYEWESVLRGLVSTH